MQGVVKKAVQSFKHYTHLHASRFYNRLPEVRRKRLEEKRLATYESNRQNAKAYQQVYIHVITCVCRSGKYTLLDYTEVES